MFVNNLNQLHEVPLDKLRIALAIVLPTGFSLLIKSSKPETSILNHLSLLHQFMFSSHLYLGPITVKS